MSVGLALVGCAGGPGPEAPSAFLVQKMRPLPPLTPKVDGSASGSRLWLEIRHQADPGPKAQSAGLWPTSLRAFGGKEMGKGAWE